MTNYFREGSYPLAAIRDFVTSQRNLFMVSPMTGGEVESSQTVFLLPYVPHGPIDLFFRFSDDQQATPAVGFRELKETNDEGEDLYRLVLIDPSLQALWEKAMDHE